MSRIFLALLLTAAWLDAHAQSSLPPCPRFASVTTWANCFGTFTFDEGEYKGQKYVGEFLRDGVFHGQGTYTWPNGDKYVGGFRLGKWHGHGAATWANGSKYVGEVRDGKADGQGTNTWANGDKYVGGYLDDKFHGQGTFTFADGRKYVGEWKDGAYNGQGTLTLLTGDKYVGDFRGGKYHGQGAYTFADGRKYVGEWRDDKQNGLGIEYAKNGEVQESGMWRDGQLLQSFPIDTARLPLGASSSVEIKDQPIQEPNKKTSVGIVNDCLAKGLKPGTSQFSKCVAGQ